MDPIEEYVKAKFLEYTRKVIIPKIKKYLITKNISATKEYEKAMEAKALKTAGTIVRVGIYSKSYSKYVEGPSSKFEAGRVIGKNGIKNLEKWVKAKGVIFSRWRDGYDTGKPLSSLETARVIAASMTRKGRKARFFIDLITEQEVANFEENLFKDENLEKEFTGI